MLSVEIRDSEPRIPLIPGQKTTNHELCSVTHGWVVVDTFSGWLEAATNDDRKAVTIIDNLSAIFARFGVPPLVVSDNTRGEMCAWLKGIGCRPMHSREYHPASNGSGDTMVLVIKDALECYNPSKASLAAFIQRILFVHRITA